MSSSLHNFTLAWNLGFRFFLDPSTSPRFLLDWDHRNADGTHLALGYGVESFRTPHRFFHKRSDTALLEPYLGLASGSRGIVGPEPIRRLDLFFHYWLVTSQFSPAGVFCIPFIWFLNQVLVSPPCFSPFSSCLRVPSHNRGLSSGVVAGRNRAPALPRMCVARVLVC
jgi:hypothetical protein